MPRDPQRVVGEVVLEHTGLIHPELAEAIVDSLREAGWHLVSSPMLESAPAPVSPGAKQFRLQGVVDGAVVQCQKFATRDFLRYSQAPEDAVKFALGREYGRHLMRRLHVPGWGRA